MRADTDSLTTLADRAQAVSFSRDEYLRYSRHLIMPEVAIHGQKRLKAASVLLIGAGGLGSPLGLYLAAAGVGRIGLVDFDAVDFSNLQRQILHTTRDVGRPKLDSAREHLAAINPDVRLDLYETRLSCDNVMNIIEPYDIVIDGTDNFPTRYLVNDACVLAGKPNVYGSIFRFDGQASVFWPPRGPCYRCLYPEPPPPGMVPSCAEGGVLGILPGVVGCIQATEAIKLILGKGDPLIGRLLLYDALDMRFRELKVRRNPDCPLCGDHPTIHALIDYEQFCGVRGDESAPISHFAGGLARREGPAPGAPLSEITVADLHRRLQRGDMPFILDVRNPEEYAICRLEGSTLIPLPQLPSRLHELDGTREIIVHCRSGQRSAMACELLRAAGFANTKNLAGGILAWAHEIDPTMPVY